MKKLFAVLMAIALVLSMGTTMAFAEDEVTNPGKITINNAIKDSTYSAYQMLVFTASNDEGTKGIYTIAEGWADFFANDATAKEYFTVDATRSPETVSFVAGKDADQTIAKAALAYAKNHKDTIKAAATEKATGKDVVLGNLNYGYYVVDTTVGTMTALTNTNSSTQTWEKNAQPDITKEVQEDRDDSWGDVNDADIDQQVNYRSTIFVGKGVTNYVMHDTMEESLTFNNDVKVYVDGVEVNAANYTVVTGDDLDDDHTFDVKFEDSFIKSIEDPSRVVEIVVEYSATLNDKAVIGAEEDGNENTVYLSYGEDSTWETQEHKTSTYTWEMDVFKFTKEGENKVALAGAKFQLIDANDEAINFVRIDDTDGVPTYRVAVDGDTNVTDTIVTEETTGKFIIVGLDEGSYKLRETEAPAGYNKLAQDMDVIITSALDGREDNNVSYKINNATPATIEVENKTGGLFPETGGIGTTIFYLVGGLLMLGAFVFLVSKKRMATAV